MAPVPKTFTRFQMLEQCSGKLGHDVFLQMLFCCLFSGYFGGFDVESTGELSSIANKI